MKLRMLIDNVIVNGEFWKVTEKSVVQFKYFPSSSRRDPTNMKQDYVYTFILS
jgi:hypothetical protein